MKLNGIKQRQENTGKQVLLKKGKLRWVLVFLMCKEAVVEQDIVEVQVVEVALEGSTGGTGGISPN